MIDLGVGKFETLNDEIYIGNHKIDEIWKGNKKIYPENSGFEAKYFYGWKYSIDLDLKTLLGGVNGDEEGYIVYSDDTSLYSKIRKIAFYESIVNLGPTRISWRIYGVYIDCYDNNRDHSNAFKLTGYISKDDSYVYNGVENKEYFNSLAIGMNPMYDCLSYGPARSNFVDANNNPILKYRTSTHYGGMAIFDNSSDALHYVLS